MGKSPNNKAGGSAAHERAQPLERRGLQSDPAGPRAQAFGDRLAHAPHALANPRGLGEQCEIEIDDPVSGRGDVIRDPAGASLALFEPA